MKNFDIVNGPKNVSAIVQGCMRMPSLSKEDAANVIVTKKRTFEASASYKNQHVAVHNFASASNPGGGVTKGANAQEEYLCRCSGLYFCLNTSAMWDGFYKPHRDAHDPIHNDDIIYTPGVTVFKSDTAVPQLLPETEWYDVDIITSAYCYTHIIGILSNSQFIDRINNIIFVIH